MGSSSSREDSGKPQIFPPPPVWPPSVPLADRFAPNLYLPAVKVTNHQYRVDPQAKVGTYLPLGRMMSSFGWSDMYGKLDEYLPEYFRRYLNDDFSVAMRKPAALYKEGNDQWIPEIAKVLKAFPEVSGMVDDVMQGFLQRDPNYTVQRGGNLKPFCVAMAKIGKYDTLYLTDLQEIWTAEPDVPLVTLKDLQPQYWPYWKKAVPRWLYPRINLLATKEIQGVPVTNLMILASRGWHQYLELALYQTEINVDRLTEALPYAVWDQSTMNLLQEKGGKITDLVKQYQAQYFFPKRFPQLAQVRGTQLLNFWEIFGYIRYYESDPDSLLQVMADPAGDYYSIDYRPERNYGILPLLAQNPNYLPYFGNYTYADYTGKLVDFTIVAYLSSVKIKYVYYHYPEKFLALADWLIQALAELHRQGFVHLNISSSAVHETQSGYVLSEFEKSTRLTRQNATTDYVQILETLLNLWQGDKTEPFFLALQAIQTYPAVEYDERLMDAVQTEQARLARIQAAAEEAKRLHQQAQAAAEERRIRLAREAMEREGPKGKNYFAVAQFKEENGRRMLVNKSEALIQEKKISEGGFGAVYIARDPAGRKFALKIEDPKKIWEDEIVPRISAYPNCDPNLVCAYDTFYFKDEAGKLKRGILYQLIEGDEIGKYVVKDKPTSLPGFTLWLLQTIQKLHEQGVAHRDIKPQNIMIERATGQYKLIDFGLACDLPKCSRAGGTYGYMAPEVMWGTVKDYLAADVYSVGATLKSIYTVLGYPSSQEEALINSMMEHDPEKRITLTQAIAELTPYPASPTRRR